MNIPQAVSPILQIIVEIVGRYAHKTLDKTRKLTNITTAREWIAPELTKAGLLFHVDAFFSGDRDSAEELIKAAGCWPIYYLLPL